MTPAVERIAAVLRLELRTQWREPLTLLYMLVFALLAAAFAAAGPVELVRGRGAVPRDAAWSVWLAATALTAIGQVITTMVAATVVLRDRADRMHDLLVTTSLRRHEYLAGKLVAALIMLCAIYAVIPIGLVIGALVGGGDGVHALRSAMPSFVMLVLPTMLAVGALQFAVGVLSGALWVIVAQGLLLIWLWTACADAASSPAVGAAAALLDPFGTAPILRVSAAWSDSERALRSMPVTVALLANRALWLVIGFSAAAWAIARGPGHVRDGARHAPIDTDNAREPRTSARVAVPLMRGGSVSRVRGLWAIAGHTLQWMTRDTGWRVLALLGAVNVGVHAYVDAEVVRDAGAAVRSTAVSIVVLYALQQHARLFLILLATIYAGELVWRERDDRSAAQVDVQPVRDTAFVLGRIAGAIGAQVLLVLLLTSVAVLCAMSGARAPVAPWVLANGMLRTVLAPFVMWMLLSLLAHVIVQQKLAAHLVCIAAWVLGVLTSQLAAVGGASDATGWRALAWGVVAVVLTWLAWVRGEPGSVAMRYRTLRRRAGLS